MSQAFYRNNKELDFSINGLGKQKVLTEAESTYRQLLLLLLLRPGDYPSKPEMGIHISRRIRYKNLDHVMGGSLKDEIVRQVRKYTPEVDMTDMNIWQARYKGEWYVILDFELLANKTISIAMTRKSTSLLDIKVEFD